jgi:hypothetical protein
MGVLASPSQAQFTESPHKIEFPLQARPGKRTLFVKWRFYEVKLAARLGLEGLIDYSTSILSFFFYLPAILLWMATIFVGASIGWRVLRWDDSCS